MDGIMGRMQGANSCLSSDGGISKADIKRSAMCSTYEAENGRAASILHNLWSYVTGKLLKSNW